MAKDADFIEKAASTRGGSIRNDTLMPATDKMKPKGHTNEGGTITATSHPHKDLNFRAHLLGMVRVMGGLQDSLEVEDSADHATVQDNLEIYKKQQASDRQLEMYADTMRASSDLAAAELETLMPTMALLQGGSQ